MHSAHEEGHVTHTGMRGCRARAAWGQGMRPPPVAWLTNSTLPSRVDVVCRCVCVPDAGGRMGGPVTGGARVSVSPYVCCGQACVWCGLGRWRGFVQPRHARRRQQGQTWALVDAG